MHFYRERESGDYLTVDPETLRMDPLREWPCEVLDARASACVGDPSSVQGTIVGHAYLDGQCDRVERSEVPERWLRYLDPQEEPCS